MSTSVGVIRWCFVPSIPVSSLRRGSGRPDRWPLTGIPPLAAITTRFSTSPIEYQGAAGKPPVDPDERDQQHVRGQQQRRSPTASRRTDRARAAPAAPRPAHGHAPPVDPAPLEVAQAPAREEPGDEAGEDDDQDECHGGKVRGWSGPRWDCPARRSEVQRANAAALATPPRDSSVPSRHGDEFRRRLLRARERVLAGAPRGHRPLRRRPGAADARRASARRRRRQPDRHVRAEPLEAAAADADPDLHDDLRTKAEAHAAADAINEVHRVSTGSIPHRQALRRPRPSSCCTSTHASSIPRSCSSSSRSARSTTRAAAIPRGADARRGALPGAPGDDPRRPFPGCEPGSPTSRTAASSR